MRKSICVSWDVSRKIFSGRITSIIVPVEKSNRVVVTSGTVTMGSDMNIITTPRFTYDQTINEGDILKVKEPYALRYEYNEMTMKEYLETNRIWSILYKSIPGNKSLFDNTTDFNKWRSPLRMPLSIARSVQITGAYILKIHSINNTIIRDCGYLSTRLFHNRWNERYGKSYIAYHHNPFVWVINFRTM